MLVREPDRVAEFVPRRAAVEKTEIHRRLVERDAAAIGADVGPGAVVGVERDADFRIGRVVEIELQVGHLRPPPGLLPRDGLFWRCRP